MSSSGCRACRTYEQGRGGIAGEIALAAHKCLRTESKAVKKRLHIIDVMTGVACAAHEQRRTACGCPNTDVAINDRRTHFDFTNDSTMYCMNNIILFERERP